MITMIDKHKIITLHNKGMSQRKIADDLGISRNTVASYIKEYDSLSATLFTSENLSKEQLHGLTIL